MRFSIGDIITGKDSLSYSITNNKALMLVKQCFGSNIEVVVLYHTARGHVESSYSVANDKSVFKETTFEEFTEMYPDCHKMSEDKIKVLLEKYKKRETPKLENAYILSDEMRNELLEEMKTLLTKYHYHPTDEALNIILDEWCLNKADLIRMFEKHPNYNGKFQIAFDCDFDRNLDRKAIKEFSRWLVGDEVKNILLKEVKLGVYSYAELCDICDRLHTFYRFFEKDYGVDIKDINGKTYLDYRKEYNHFKNFKNAYEKNKDLFIFSGNAYSRKSFNDYQSLDDMYSILTSSYTEQFVNDNTKDFLNRKFPDSNIRKGQKMSRAVNKILCKLGVDKAPNYNKEYAKFADAINPLKIKRHTVISIHPVDYFTMSFGNSWSSCHTIDKTNDRGIDGSNSYRGCNSSGTMSYMLDETSCVFYTVDAEYNGNTLELEDKINRCMFHYYDNQLVQGRVYPQSNDTGSDNLYKDIREIVQKIFADMLEVPNYWSKMSGTDECVKRISSSGTHYEDYANYDACNVSILKDDKDNHELIYVGHSPICPHCGKVHNRTRNIECHQCNDKE